MQQKTTPCSNHNMSTGPAKTDLTNMLQALRDSDDLFGPGGPCPFILSGNTNSRVIVVSGDNATGKSFLMKAISAHFHSTSKAEDRRIESIHLSMSKRTGADFTSGIVRAMMFGSENERSTGSISSHIVKMGFKTAAERDWANLLILDEPDIGLSEAYQSAMGQYITEQAKTLSPHTICAIIVTHSRTIARELLALNPMMIRMTSGTDQQSSEDWIKHGPPAKSIEDLVSLTSANHKRFLAIQAVLNARRG